MGVWEFGDDYLLKKNYSEIYQSNIFFYFLKIIFDISKYIKISENIKKYINLKQKNKIKFKLFQKYF